MKRLSVIMVAVMALTVLVSGPAFSDDKLIVMDSGGTNPVFKVTDGGQIALPSAVGTNRSSGISNAATVDNFGLVSFYPSSGTNVGSALQVIPKGTGKSAGIKSQLSVYNTDYIADSVNTEVLVLRAAGATGYTFNSIASGTGAVRPIIFQMNNAAKMTLGTDGHLTMAGGAYTDGLAWYPSSSREYKENIQTLSAKEAIETVKNLNPVTFVYKQDPEQGHVGFIAEDVPDAVALNGRKAIDPVNIIAILTKVVQEQSKTIEALSSKVEKLEKNMQNQ
jgi:hypothetical protein